MRVSDFILAFGILAVLATLVLVPPAPTVYKSDGVCVKVQPSDAGTCSNLPDSYAVVHVAPAWAR